jgi:formylglycine-generating enzyme required for sulfatase activity
LGSALTPNAYGRKSRLGGAELEVRAAGWLGTLLQHLQSPRQRLATTTAILASAIVFVIGAFWLGRGLLGDASKTTEDRHLSATLSPARASDATALEKDGDPTEGRGPGRARDEPDAQQHSEPSAAAALIVDLDNDVRMELAYIPPGRFTMGSNAGDRDEKPPYRVRLTEGFYIGRHEVTRVQFAAFVQATGHKTVAESDGLATVWTAAEGYFEKDGASWKAPGFPQTGEHPVVCVSWMDAKAFCTWLGQKTGKTCRLPTEAQWEYACRAGSTGKWCFGDNEGGLTEYAWYEGNSNDRTHPVGRKNPNSWGLYDMHGNVWEWCEDWYAGEYYRHSPREDPTGPAIGRDRVLRGGTWCGESDECRSAYRDGYAPTETFADTGFRVVISMSTP